jgi:hypothetical protein
MKLVEAGGVSDVREYDRRAVDQTSRGNRTVQRIFDGSVGNASAHAALLAVSICLRWLLRESRGRQQGQERSGGQTVNVRPETTRD